MQAEWPLNGWEVAARVTPGTKAVAVHATSLTDRRSDHAELSIDDDDAPAAFAKFVRGLAKTKGAPRAGRS